MRFKDASSILDVIQNCDDVERDRGTNRAKINDLFNGGLLIDPREAKKLGLEINANLGEAAVIAQHGRRQYNQAFNSRSRYFRVSIPDAPDEKGPKWSAFITNKINRYLKKSRSYRYLQRHQWASVLLHGPAPKVWFGKEKLLPKFVALEDFRVATDTECSLENLYWFGVRRYWTEGELSRAVFGENADRRWKKDAVKPILLEYHDKQTYQVDYDWSTQPEKMAELVKQNGGYYCSDRVPVIPIWHFYYFDDDAKKPGWRLVLVPDENTLGGTSARQMLYDSRTPVADDLGNILHVQFGDLNNKAPFLYHSVRSLGFLLMEPIFHSNLLQCRFMQHIHEHMNIWLRSTDPAGRAKAQLVNLYNKAFLPEGLSIVPQAERHQIDVGLFEQGLAITKQLKNEASVSYTQDSEGRSEDETATAVMARVNQVNAMMGGLIALAAEEEQFADAEICRRFCLKGSENPEARKFIQACKQFGIPSQFLDSEMWDVEREIPIGGGNPTMEMAKIQQLMAWREKFPPQAQQEILYEAAITITDDPRKAERWVPIDDAGGITAAQEHAELAFGALMQGVPVTAKNGFNPIDQVETLLGSLAGVITRIEKTGNMATPAEVFGLRNVEKYAAALIQQLAQDEQQKPIAKQMADTLGKLMNTVKGFEQRLSQNNGNGNGDGKQQAALLQAATKIKISEAKSQQQQRHKEQAFQLDQRRKDAEALAQISRDHLKTAEEVRMNRFTTFSTPSNE